MKEVKAVPRPQTDDPKELKKTVDALCDALKKANDAIAQLQSRSKRTPSQ